MKNKKFLSLVLVFVLMATLIWPAGTPALAGPIPIIDVSDSSGTNLPDGVTYNPTGKLFTIGTLANNSTIPVLGTTTANTIAVATGVTGLTLILNGVTIDLSGGSANAAPIDILGTSNVTIKLADGTSNVLNANNTSNTKAGLHVTTSKTVTIVGDTLGTGTLTATGGKSTSFAGAGIGGNKNEAAGIVNITGGTVTATGGYGGAGIGGGDGGYAGTVNISGGTVTATGGFCGAGIGGGRGGYGGTVNISGGTVIASGNNNGGAGIGGGAGGSGGTVNISGGTVTATGKAQCAGIGNGNGAGGGDITISGTAHVTATGASNGPGIGGPSCIITINGGIVNATGGSVGPGIGDGGASGTVNINGGIVTATGNAEAAGIGGGSGGAGGTIKINGGTVSATGGYNINTGLGGAGIGGGGDGASANITIDSSAVVMAASFGGTGKKPAIDAKNVSTGSVMNAMLNSAISAYYPTYLKCNGNTLILPKAYQNFAFSAASAVTAYSDQALTLPVGNIVTNPGGSTSIPTTDLSTNPADVTPVKLQSAVINVGDSSGANLPVGVTYAGNLFTIGAGANNTTITVTGTTTTNKVLVDGVTVNIILNSVSIQLLSSDAHNAFTLSGGANVTLTLTGNNILKGNANGNGGLSVPNGQTVTIQGTGKLTASAKENAAAIGGYTASNSCGTINIISGTVIASGGDGGGSGIGGTNGGNGGIINISGGTVTATGDLGAGIGGGQGTNGGSINISGGTVKASSTGAAGIGGGAYGSGGTINISNGDVTATGGYGGAGIGGGTYLDATNTGATGTITISGGTVTASGGRYYSTDYGAAGIGCGINGTGMFDPTGSVTISAAATVKASAYGTALPAIQPVTGASTAKILLAIFTAVKAANTSTAVYVKAPTSLSASFAPAVDYQSIAFTVPANDTYQLKRTASGILQQHNSGPSSDFAIAANGITQFNGVTDVLFALTVNLDGGSGATTSGSYVSGASVSIDAGTKSGFAFAGWTSTGGGTFANSNSASTTYNMPGNAASITATWTPAYLLTVNLDGGNGATTSGSHVSGASVSIDSGTKSGYTFSGWTSSAGGTFGSSSSAATTFTMPGNATTITAHWTLNGGSGGGSYTPPANNNTIVIVDNKDYSIGTENKNDQNTTATVDQPKLTDEIAKASDSSSVIVPVSANTNVTAQLVVKNVEDMAKKDMVLTVQTGNVAYNLNTSAIDTSKITASLGNADSKEIPFNVSISNSKAVVNGATVVVSPVEFTITATYNGKTASVDTFSCFVDRTIEITADQAKQITTAVVVQPDGSLRHVPTKVTVVNGKYYAVINSLTNSTYTVVWHPVEFSDVVTNWAKNSINDMGSRMVVTGVGNNNYEPDRDITRAEFAAIVVRALGLAPGTGKSTFSDVDSGAWYCGYIATASAYGIVQGYSATTFGPSDTISREQAMTMISRAMAITGLKPQLADSDISVLLGKYSDAAVASDYAKSSIGACLKTGIITGRSSTLLAPKDFITRAEVAVIVQRLLQKSGLI